MKVYQSAPNVTLYSFRWSVCLCFIFSICTVVFCFYLLGLRDECPEVLIYHCLRPPCDAKNVNGSGQVCVNIPLA
jgi:hypothetical protein